MRLKTEQVITVRNNGGTSNFLGYRATLGNHS